MGWTPCLGFKELHCGKAAMEEEVEEVPVIYTNTDTIHFVLLVIRSCLYVASMFVVQSFADVRTGSH